MHTIVIHQSKLSLFRQAANNLGIPYLSSSPDEKGNLPIRLDCNSSQLFQIGFNCGIIAAAELTSSINLKP